MDVNILGEIKSKKIATFDCPHCSKEIELFKDTEIFSEAVKADKEDRFRAVKSTQTKLKDHQED